MSHEARITVLYFAAASTAAGVTSEEVPIPEQPFKLSSLGALLSSRHPNTGLDEVLQSSRWSVNEEMVDVEEVVELKGGEEVAIICPVSGG
ncbi:hypothetical protein AX17_007324 [Amanita inopinata Kibby_2008]|nr:hypothetical protein AX17_007324 [Amanita inopinata Kibby_2008]